jgi:hypothetical protein
MHRVAAMSRKFPPNYKRKWYIVKFKEKYKIRYKGKTSAHQCADLHDALDQIGML